MRIKVPSISDNEAIEAFITGLRFHDALRDKLLRKRPKLVTALLATAKKYADANDAKKIIIEEAARVPRSDHPPHRDDYRGNRGRNDNFELGVKHLYVYGDSALVINQLNKDWDTTSEKMDAYCKSIRKLEGKFYGIEYTHVVRDKN